MRTPFEELTNLIYDVKRKIKVIKDLESAEGSHEDIKSLREALISVREDLERVPEILVKMNTHTDYLINRCKLSREKEALKLR